MSHDVCPVRGTIHKYSPRLSIKLFWYFNWYFYSKEIKDIENIDLFSQVKFVQSLKHRLVVQWVVGFFNVLLSAVCIAIPSFGGWGVTLSEYHPLVNLRGVIDLSTEFERTGILLGDACAPCGLNIIFMKHLGEGIKYWLPTKNGVPSGTLSSPQF